MTDASISTILLSIEMKANHLSGHAYQLSRYVHSLTYQRNFETRAEAAIDLAEKELSDALAKVRLIKAEFLAKPVEA